jgi:hypothetical protein
LPVELNRQALRGEKALNFLFCAYLRPIVIIR